MAWYSQYGQSDKMYQAEALWLGITNHTESNVWVSDRTGEPVLYNNWLDTEPTTRMTTRDVPASSSTGTSIMTSNSSRLVGSL